MIRDESSAEAFLEPPAGFPSSPIKLTKHEARALHEVNNGREFDGATTFVQRMLACLNECDGLGFKSCREIEGKYCDFLERKFKKPVMLAGFVVPEAPTSTLDGKWRKWLDDFDAKSIVYCSFGSEARLRKDQFQEVVLGLELTGFPFLAALKPPVGAETVEEALPLGLSRGVVVGEWVQQQLILKHASVGCFVTHGGSGSLSEAMVSECGIVAAAHAGDQVINSRLVAGELRVGVEVERDGDGLLTKERVAEAVKIVMEGESETGKEVRRNHARWRELLLGEGVEDSYIDGFVRDLLLLLQQ